ncbi:MAG: metallophosphoesterase [Butyrivibrio sp.]
MRKTKKVVAAVLMATMVASLAMGTSEAYARSSMRAAWNDASSSQTTGTQVKDACYVEDGSETDEHTVYSNVYADSEEWNEWKTKWENVKNNYELAALTPGEDATKLNFAWYSLTQETPMVKLMDADGDTIRIFEGSQDTAAAETFNDGTADVTLYPGKVTVTGLTENTTYKYQYLVDGQWSDTYEYKTQSTDSFSVMYVGDPQIGASTAQETAAGTTENKEYYAMNDAYNWYHTLENAVSAHSNLSFILSAGDQINQTSVSNDANKLQQQIEYSGFLNPSVLRSLPIAPTIGNHDSKSVNYSNHFYYPNIQTSSDNTNGKTAAGTDYYFRYGNTLFISIDTNNYNCATHENVIKEAIQNNDDTVWKILMFHQDIYGSGYDHSDTDGIALRTQLTPLIDKYDIDVVLQGHDHTYSRTYQLSADGQTHTAYTSAPSTGTDEFAAYLEQNNCYDVLTGTADVNKVIDPEGTVYFEANSSTGSKFYQLIGTQQDYIAARCQSWRPTYSVIDITETTLTVRTYDAATNEELVADGGIKTAYTIVKSADKTALETQLETADSAYQAALKAGNYTEESVKALLSTIEAAQKIFDNAESDSQAVASAITSLQDAVKALTLKKTDTGSGQNPGNVGVGDSAMPVWVWFGIAGVSLVGAAGLVISDKKRKVTE